MSHIIRSNDLRRCSINNIWRCSKEFIIDSEDVDDGVECVIACGHHPFLFLHEHWLFSE